MNALVNEWIAKAEAKLEQFTVVMPHQSLCRSDVPVACHKERDGDVASTTLR